VKFLLRYLELILSAAGLVVILVVPALFFPSRQYRWVAAAATATSVGVIHGLIFFGVRHRQRTLRSQTIREIQLLVDDLVRNQLAVISLSSEIASDASETADAGEFRKWAKQSYEAAKKIESGLQHIDADGLTASTRRYAELIHHEP
jgi:hypothetical protein